LTQGVPLPELVAEVPGELLPIWDPEEPWAALGAGLDELLATLPSERIAGTLDPDVHLVGDRIVVGAGSRIASGAYIQGPAFIGRDVDIRTGAYIRGGVWIGDGCTVGANTEVKRSILLPGAKAPHLNYVGDSVLGRDVNLGAGTVLSNFRHDGGEIRIASPQGSLATGRRKLGAVLGDAVKTGCNSVLHPGVVVGRGTEIYPLVQLRSGIYAADSIVKLRQQLEVAPRRR
jgi:NDP-sugar pyrophosphorylase family protein